MPSRPFATLIVLFLVGLTASPTMGLGQESAGAAPVVFFPVRKAIDSRLNTILQGDVDRAIAEHDLRFLVIELDTPGGDLEASRDLAAYLSALDQRGVETFAWVPSGREAYSGGTLIALACRTLVMGNNSRIGDVQPIDLFGQELPEKIQTTVRADMRRYSRERGYPVPLAEAMVSKDLGVFEVRERDASGVRKRYMTEQQLDDLDPTKRREMSPRRVVEKGQILTIDEKEAFEYGFVQHICTSPEQLLLDHGLNGRIVDIDQFLGRQRIAGASNFLDPFTGWPNFVKFLLIMVGALSLVVELKFPGVGLGSILSLAFFALFLLCGYADGNVGWIEIGLFGCGLVLMAIELFVIPGFGISGLLGLGTIFTSLVLALQPVDADLQLEQLSESGLLVLGGLGGGLLMIFLLLHFLPGGNRGGGLVSGTSLASDDPAQASPGFTGSDLKPGTRGEVLHDLRPAGKARIDGRILDVVADGGFIEKGAEVEVVAVEGNRVVVRTIASEA